MNINELKSKVEKYRSDLEEKSGKACIFSETGPVGMSLIDALVAALESQELRIAELENGPRLAE